MVEIKTNQTIIMTKGFCSKTVEPTLETNKIIANTSDNNR
jgi:hypothetical protein